MEDPNDKLMKDILSNNLKLIKLNKEIKVAKICTNGMSLMGAAAKTGNLQLLKVLIEFNNNNKKNATLTNNSNNKSSNSNLENNVVYNNKNNVGYFVVSRVEPENEFGDGPTPEEMDRLEWDMEVNDDNNLNMPESDSCDDSTINLYRWYAKVLNETAVLLKSPQRDVLSDLDRHGRSILHYAVGSCSKDSKEIVEYLLDNFGKELTVNLLDSYGFTCLHYAVRKQDIDLVRCLLSRGANTNAIGGDARITPLHIAANKCNAAIIRLLLESGSNVNALEALDRTPLSFTLSGGNEECSRILCEAGSMINNEEYLSQSIPLDWAIYSENPNVVRLLLQHGARLAPNRHYLHKAVLLNNLEIVKILVENGMFLNSRDSLGYTPLMRACVNKQLPIIQYLLSMGANPNAFNYDHKTPLHLCSEDKPFKDVHLKIIELLLHHGASFNVPYTCGSVLLHAIIYHNDLCASALVRHGAEVDVVDEPTGWDTMNLTQRYGTLQLCKELIYAGFNLHNAKQYCVRYPKRSEKEIESYIKFSRSNPLNLKQLCRIVIRRKIGTNRLCEKIQSLPLPKITKSYLCLEILE